MITGVTGFAGFESIIDCITNCNGRSRSRIDKVKTVLGRSCITGIREWEQDGLLVEEESGYMMYYHILFDEIYDGLLGTSDEFIARVDLGALDVFIGVFLFVEGYVRLIYTPGEFIDLVLFFIFYLVTDIHQMNLFLFGKIYGGLLGASDEFMTRVLFGDVYTALDESVDDYNSSADPDVFVFVQLMG